MANREAEQMIADAGRMMTPGTLEALIAADEKLDDAVALLRESNRREKAHDPRYDYITCPICLLRWHPADFISALHVCVTP